VEKKKRTNFLDRIADKFDIPSDALLDHPRVTVIGGGRVLVENHKGLTDYGTEEITVAGRGLMLKINGSELELRAMNMDALLITGNIFKLEFVY